MLDPNVPLCKPQRARGYWMQMTGPFYGGRDAQLDMRLWTCGCGK